MAEKKKSRQWLDGKSPEEMRDLLIVQKQLHAIESQLYQKEGYPYNIKDLKTILHQINQGEFRNFGSLLGIGSDPKFEVVLAFPVVYSTAPTASNLKRIFYLKDWPFDEKLNSGNFPWDHLFPAPKRGLVVISRTTDWVSCDDAIRHIADQGGQLPGLPGLAMLARYWLDGDEFLPKGITVGLDKKEHLLAVEEDEGDINHTTDIVDYSVPFLGRRSDRKLDFGLKLFSEGIPAGFYIVHFLAI